jgi:hypothetical protein
MKPVGEVSDEEIEREPTGGDAQQFVAADRARNAALAER